MPNPDSLQVQQQTLGDRRILMDEWQELEARSDNHVFLSWQWIGIWLHVYAPEVQVLKVYTGRTLVGLGLLVPGRERRHGVVQSRSLRLHQTGFQEEDQIWIEYNGFLAARGFEREVASACLRYLCDSRTDWEELILGAMEVGAADHLREVSGLTSRVRWEAPCYGVPLQGLAPGLDPYLMTLKANTRHQIRRSKRLYEERGALDLKRPTTLREALATFDLIGPRHRERWGTGPNQSGFSNPAFVKFHRALIERHWQSGGVDLVSLVVDGKTIASFYNLCYRERVYFYLGGLQVEQDNRFKPGLLGHALCIADYAEAGFEYYDFMGGEERYKTQLGHWHQQLVQVSLQRDRFKFRLEQAARQAKQQWTRRTESSRVSESAAETGQRYCLNFPSELTRIAGT